MNKPEAIQFADDRPLSLNDDLYQWAYDAEELIRAMQSRIEALEKTKESLCKALDDAGDSLIEVADKIEALEKDAARYRWLRLHMVNDGVEESIDIFDSTIDTAMQSEKWGM